jgi:NTP pyrophosphatase (non-canonical NTP hydrolase)
MSPGPLIPGPSPNSPKPPDVFAIPPALQQKNLLVKLVDQCVADSSRYFEMPERGDFEALKHYVLALCGEAGELANVVKKIDRGSLTMDQEATKFMLESEATDVLIYLLNIYGALGIDPLRAFVKKRDYNNSRFNNREVR